jgi:ABC-2 type transport system ATP-binding protein
MLAANASISAENLTKTYQVSEREGGFRAAVSSIVRRKFKSVHAVQNVSFSIREGEMVGFVGPNGAGKTTTLKMLSGLLYPSAGNARVLGFTPWELKREYLRSMTLVMGQRSRLSWDIPAADSFLLHQAIYRIPDADYRRTLKELDELLELAPILRKPVRNLSLGERMKCELAVGLLHRPRVLFLDEPTIGLDITAQARIRAFLLEYNRRNGSTILLTSHYMADVTALCERVLIIHHGRLKYDGGLAELSRRIAPFKRIGVAVVGGAKPDLTKYGKPVGCDEDDEKCYVEVRAEEVALVTARLLADLPVHDITITDPPIEYVIEQALAE